jgi:heme-degrading monooxygenase HmoA
MAFHVVWEFRVRPGREEEFERRCGATGDWVRLFRQSEGFVGTVLLKDRGTARRYLVTDTWRDAAAYRAFKEQHAAAYAALDLECAALTEEERRLGEFEPL